MRLRPFCLAVTVLAGTAMAGPASAEECAPARIDGDPATLPRPWRRALEALVAATAREGQPWSCTGARVTLVPPGDRGLPQLEVEDAGGVRRRAVRAPAEVVPLGEAMLARVVVIEVLPRDAPAPPPPPPPLPVADASDLVEPAAAPTAESPRPARRGPGPRWASPTHGILVDALAGARFTGPTRAILMGAELRAAMVFDRWSVGLMARYDSAVAVLQPVPDQFSLSSVSIGIPGGYRVHAGPVELTAAVEPSLAVVLMGALKPGDAEPDVDAHVDMRLGARLGLAVPVSERIRVVCAFGGEGAPAALFDDRHSRRKLLPELPGYLPRPLGRRGGRGAPVNAERCAMAPLLEARRDGRLGAREDASLARHVATCADCQALERDLDDVRRLLRAPPPARPLTPLDHQRGRLALLRAAVAPPPPAPSASTGTRLVVAKAIPAIAAMACLGVAMGGPRPPQTPREIPSAVLSPAAVSAAAPPPAALSPAAVLPAATLVPTAPAPEPASPSPSGWARRVRHANEGEGGWAVRPSTDEEASKAFGDAVDMLGRGDYAAAHARLDAFRAAHPADARADLAAFLTIVSLQHAGRRAEAQEAARRYLELYPRGDRREEALRVAEGR